MHRRELLRLGISVVPAGLWAQHHPEVPSSLVSSNVSDPGWMPVFFNAQQNAMAIVLSEMIIPQTDTPGATGALVNRYMDKLLAASKPEQRRPLTSGMAWLDQYSKKSGGKAFTDLSAERRNAILTRISTAGSDGDLAEGYRFFQTFKSFTASIYYSTEIGFNELNKGGRVPRSNGCAA